MAPLHGPRREDVAPEPASEQSLDLARGVNQGDEVDAGRDPHLVQHRDEILGRDIAGRADGHRTAAELAEARLEALDPDLQCGEHVGQALAAGVVEVSGQLDVGQAGAGRREEVADLERVGHPGRVAEADLHRAGVRQALGDP